MTAEPKSLMTLVSDANEIMQSIIENGGELTSELELKLSQVDLALADKRDAYVFVLSKLEAEEAYWKNRAEMFIKVAKATSRIREKMRDSIKHSMIARGEKECAGHDHRFVLTPTAERLVLDQAMIPQDFKMLSQEWVPDKERIKAELQSLGNVPGAKLEGGFALRIYPVKGGQK